MRPLELAAAATRPGGRTVAATGSDDPSPNGPEKSHVGPLDTVVLALDDAAATEPLAALLGTVPDGARVLVLLPCAVVEIPVGRLVDTAVRGASSVAAVVPVDDRSHPVALLLERSRSAPSVTWLPSRGFVDLDADQSRRLAAELVLGGATARAQAMADAARIEVLRRRAVAAEADVARLTEVAARLRDAAERLRTSRSYEVGQALAEVRKAPFSGAVKLPGRLRRAGRPASGR